MTQPLEFLRAIGSFRDPSVEPAAIVAARLAREVSDQKPIECIGRIAGRAGGERRLEVVSHIVRMSLQKEKRTREALPLAGGIYSQLRPDAPVLNAVTRSAVKYGARRVRSILNARAIWASTVLTEMPSAAAIAA